MALQVVGDDADGRKGDGASFKLHEMRPARLFAVQAGARCRQNAVAAQTSYMAERFVEARHAVVHRMVVGEGDQIEALGHEMAQALGMHAEIERPALTLAVRG